MRADTPFVGLLGKAQWSTAYVNRLPDSAFLYIEPGGTKDAAGKTTPRSLRHLPVYDADGQVDAAHLRNAISQIPKAGPWASTKLKTTLAERAKGLLAELQKSDPVTAVIPDFALAYLSHIDLACALGIPGDKASSTWTGDAGIGTRAKSYVASHRVEKRAVAVTKAVESSLRKRVAAFNQGRTERKVTLRMLKTVWARGAESIAAAERPYVKSAIQCGAARVDAFLKFVRVGKVDPNKYAGDADMLPADHPKSPKYKPVAKDVPTADGAATTESPETDAETEGADGTEDELDVGEPRLFQGIPIVIDRPIGFVQRGTSPDGTAWERTYTADYGYIPSTLGGDGDELDIFLGPHLDAPMTYWVNQLKPDGTLDEYKVMLGFGSMAEAKACYLAHVPARFMGGVWATEIGALRALLGLNPADVQSIVATASMPDVGRSSDGKPYIDFGPRPVNMAGDVGAREQRLHAETLADYAALLTAIETALVPGLDIAVITDPSKQAGPGQGAALYVYREGPTSGAPEGATVFHVDGAEGWVFAATYELPASDRIRMPGAEAADTAPTEGDGEALAGQSTDQPTTFVRKSEGEVADEERYVLGPVLIPDVFDKQGHIIAASVIRQMCFGWMANYQNTTVQHTEKPEELKGYGFKDARLENPDVTPVENYLVKAGGETYGDRTMPEGTWMLGAILSQDKWADVKAGKFTGWSIGGLGMTVPVDETGAPLTSTQEPAKAA